MEGPLVQRVWFDLPVISKTEGFTAKNAVMYGMITRSVSVDSIMLRLYVSTSTFLRRETTKPSKTEVALIAYTLHGKLSLMLNRYPSPKLALHRWCPDKGAQRRAVMY